MKNTSRDVISRSELDALQVLTDNIALAEAVLAEMKVLLQKDSASIKARLLAGAAIERKFTPPTPAPQKPRGVRSSRKEKLSARGRGKKL